MNIPWSREKHEPLSPKVEDGTYLREPLDICGPEVERLRVQCLQVVPVRRVDELPRTLLQRPIDAKL